MSFFRDDMSGGKIFLLGLLFVLAIFAVISGVNMLVGGPGHCLHIFSTGDFECIGKDVGGIFEKIDDFIEWLNRP